MAFAKLILAIFNHVFWMYIHMRIISFIRATISIDHKLLKMGSDLTITICDYYYFSHYFRPFSSQTHTHWEAARFRIDFSTYVPPIFARPCPPFIMSMFYSFSHGFVFIRFSLSLHLRLKFSMCTFLIYLYYYLLYYAKARILLVFHLCTDEKHTWQQLFNLNT